MTACTTCAETLPEGARFCFACGTAQTAPGCAACGEPLVPGARFCFSCGTPVDAGHAVVAPPAVSRRVTSVLFGDLVGFTALSESRDQEDLQELQTRYFEECRRVIGRYGGTVEKFIGDAVMAVWGVPTTHEDDAERAVRAGLEVLRTIAAVGEELNVPDLAMRIGIVTGEVAVTIGAQQQGIVAGDAVSTAARVQTAAEPGQVWVDETTRLRTASAITYVDVGSHRLKGKSDPVPLWAVRAVVASVGGAQRADGLEAPLVGRDRELRVFQELFHSCEETRRPAMIVVDGDAGSGKTRLVWEFEKYIDGLSSSLVSWHSGRCLAYGEGVAFYALAEAVRGRLRAVHDGEGDLDDPTLLARALEQLVDDDEERAWLSPRMGALLGIGSVGSYPREDLFSAWATFLGRVSGASSPVVLVIDDAQYADDGLLQFVEHLLNAVTFPCFVVLLTRPGLLEHHPSLATNRRATVVHLSPLSDGDIARLLDGLVAGLPAQAREALVARSEGVPLFAVETVRSLIDRDLVVPRGGQYVLADPSALDLDAVGAPASLQALIAARLDTLSAEQRRLVDRASVLGESFSRDEIAGLCPEITDIEQVLTSLVRLQILSHESRRFSAAFGEYQFVQSVVRQVAYASLSRRDRKAIHLAVVSVLEEVEGRVVEDAAILAQHLLEAVDAAPGDPDVAQLRERASRHLRVAAERARSLGSPNEAAGHLQVALGLGATDADLAEVERLLAEVLLDAGRFIECAEHAARAVGLFVSLGDRVEAGRAAADQARAVLSGGDNEGAAAVAEPWWEELKDREDASRALLSLSSALTTAKARLGLDHRDLIEAYVKLAETSGDAGVLADAYTRFSLYYAATGAMGIARILLRAAADLARDNHQPSPLVLALNNLAAATLIEDLDEAVVFAEEGLTVAQASGLSLYTSFVAFNLLLARWSRGDWSDATESISTTELSEEDVNDNGWMVVDSLLARASGSEPVRDHAVIAPAKGDDPVDMAWSALARGLAAEREGDMHAAVHFTTEAVEHFYSYAGLWDDMTTVWPAAAETALSAGDPEALQALLRLVDAVPRNSVPGGLLAHRRRVGGILALRAGDPHTAATELREALAGFEKWGSRSFAARTRGELALSLRDAGENDEAAVLLEEARSRLQELGAAAWLEELAGQPVGPVGGRPA